MGVRGLSTFIDNNQKLLSHHRLHDTKVVIDGNNLYHFLYYNYHVPHHYGGDYDHYARKCKRFFNLLTKCGVEPVIVFDGAYDPDDRKLATVLSRMRDRRSAADSICTTGHGNVMPLLAFETFRLILIELNIPHVSCDFEADDDIATLANDLNCPVMSNDSDFFIYDLRAGYIPLDYINLTLCVYDTETAEGCVCTLNKQLSQSEYRYIPVKLYNRDKFTGLFSNKNAFVIPLFATLLGNDYLDTSDLAQFYSKLQMPRSTTKFSFSPKTQSRLAALIQWLNDNEKSDLDTCVDFVADKTHSDKQEGLRKEICKSVESYTSTCQYKSVNLKSLLDRLYIRKNISTKCEQVVSDYYGNKLPTWFLDKLRSCEINPFLLNAAILHRVIFICQVEIMSEPSTYHSSQSIREVSYGLVFKSGVDSTVETDQNKYIEEYDRDQKNTKKLRIAPAESSPHYGKLPTLSAIPDLPVEERQLLIISTLGLSKEDFMSCKDVGVDGELVLLIAILSYWINHANPQVTLVHLDSFIASIIILHVKVLMWVERQTLIGLEYVEPSLYPEITQAFHNSSEKQIQRLVKNLDKFFVKPEHTAKHPRDNTIVHGFAQFQACMRDTVHQNQLLLCPFLPPNPCFIMNGTFMYNFCRDIQARVDPTSFLSEMLDRGSPLCQLFSLLKKSVLQLCKVDCFAEKRSSKKMKAKSKKNAKKAAEGFVMSEVLQTEDKGEEKGEKKPKLETVVNCSINNRFAMLNLDD